MIYKYIIKYFKYKKIASLCREKTDGKGCPHGKQNRAHGEALPARQRSLPCVCARQSQPARQSSEPYRFDREAPGRAARDTTHTQLPPTQRRRRLSPPRTSELRPPTRLADWPPRRAPPPTGRIRTSAELPRRPDASTRRRPAAPPLSPRRAPPSRTATSASR